MRAILIVLLAVATWGPTAAYDNVCDPGEAPDFLPLKVGGNVSFPEGVPQLDDVPESYGVSGDVAAFSFGSEVCNAGTCWATVDMHSELHPLISQNMFRLHEGRFEQIGQSWVKHTRSPGAMDGCGTCQIGDSTHEGVNCSDIYNSSLNGRQDFLGPRWEVNPSSGAFNYPFHLQGVEDTEDPAYKRLQVHVSDITESSTFFAEIQYVHPEEAAAGNGTNSVAYREFQVQAYNPPYPLLLTGATQSGKAGIEAWKAYDPTVHLATVDNCDGRFFVASKVTDLANGTWEYEYAVQNLNSDQSAGSFRVPVPTGTSVTSLGFHDVDYHTDIVYAQDDWPGVHDTVAKQVRFATQGYWENGYTNALRWGTLYNFRFVANVAPTVDSVALGLFKPGTHERLFASAYVPGTPAPAGQPYAAKSSVGKVVYSPAGSIPYQVTIRDINGTPLSGVSVQVQAADSYAESLVSWCANQSHSPSATTNASGVATFSIRAGGCIDPARLGYAPFVVTADGIEMARVGAASSDAVDTHGALPTDSWYEKTSPASAGLSDAAFHTPGLSAGIPEFCSDIDNIEDCNAVTLGDAIGLGNDLANGASCNVPGAGGNGNGNGNGN